MYNHTYSPALWQAIKGSRQGCRSRPGWGLPLSTSASSSTLAGAEFENKVPEYRYDYTLPLLLTYFDENFYLIFLVQILSPLSVSTCTDFYFSAAYYFFRIRKTLVILWLCFWMLPFCFELWCWVKQWSLLRGDKLD